MAEVRSSHPILTVGPDGESIAAEFLFDAVMHHLAVAAATTAVDYFMVVYLSHFLLNSVLNSALI